MLFFQILSDNPTRIQGRIQVCMCLDFNFNYNFNSYNQYPGLGTRLVFAEMVPSPIGR